MADTASLVVRVRGDGVRSTTSDLNRMSSASKYTTRTIGKLSAAITGLASVASAHKVIQYADAWQTVNNKLVNHVKVNERLIDVQERVFGLAQSTRSSLQATATLYGRLEGATEEYIKDGRTLEGLVGNINRAMQVSGATTAEAEGALVQLSQAFGAGALRGEEFNSVNEAAPRLMKALASSLGVARGQLKKMAGDGKLTTKVLFEAWGGQSRAAQEIQKEFNALTATSAAKLAVANNNLTKFIGTNEAAVASAKAYGDSVVYLSENLDELVNVSILLAGVVGGRLAGAMTASSVATASKISASIAASRADVKAASSALSRATAEKAAAVASVNSAKNALAAASGYVAESLAQDNLTKSKAIATAAEANYSRAVKVSSAANVAATATTSALAVAARGASAALSLIGGPVGLAVLAGSAIAYYYATAETAAEKSAKLAGKVDELAASFRGMNKTQRWVAMDKLKLQAADVRGELIAAQAEIVKLGESSEADRFSGLRLRDYQEDVSRLTAELDALSLKQRALFESAAPILTEKPEDVKFDTSGSDEAKKLAADRKKAEEDAKAADLAQQKEQAAAYIEQLKRDNLTELELVGYHEEDKAAKIKELKDLGLISEQEYQTALTDITTTGAAERTGIIIGQLEDEEAKRKEIRDREDAARAALKAKEDAERDRNRKKKKKVIDDARSGQSQMTDDLGAALGKQNKLYQASAIVTTTIDTYKAAQAAFSSFSGIPVVGVPLGIAAAAAATMAGLKKVQMIRSAREQGGNMVGGVPHQMLERGKAEIVVPAGASRARTLDQVRGMVGEGKGSSGGTPDVTIINNTTGRIDNASAEMDNEGRLRVLISEQVSEELMTQDSPISKARKYSAGQPGY